LIWDRDHLMEEAEFRCGALYCAGCRKTFYYRTHVLPGDDFEVFRCPECSRELRDVPVNTFLDGTEEMLDVLNQLDEESREG